MLLFSLDIHKNKFNWNICMYFLLVVTYNECFDITIVCIILFIFLREDSNNSHFDIPHKKISIDIITKAYVKMSYFPKRILLCC